MENYFIFPFTMPKVLLCEVNYGSPIKIENNNDYLDVQHKGKRMALQLFYFSG